MIDPFTLYLIIILDSVCLLFKILWIMSAAASAVSVIVYFCKMDEYQVGRLQEMPTIKGHKTHIFVSLCVFFLVANTLVPNTKQMAAIYVIPAVANNENIQELGGNVLELSNEWIESMIDEVNSDGK